MQNTSPKPKKISSTAVGLIAVGIIVVGIAAWLTPWVWVDNFPKPLGDKMEYLGKKDYGCWLGYCDSKVGATYYYATDMSLEEVTTYFRGARLDEEPRRQGYSDFEGDTIYELNFYSKNTEKQNFYLDFYADGPRNSKSLKLPATKKHLLKIDYSNYWPAKNSL